MEKKLLRVLIYVLVSFTLVILGAFGFWTYRNWWAERSAPTPVLTPTLPRKDYEEGVVLVTFNDGTTYKEARDLLSEMGLQIEGTNSYWRVQKFQPNESTELKKIDLFRIEVPVGKEDEIRDQLMQHFIVRVALKNFSAHILDDSK
jgi:hypothetical protein